MKRWLLLSLALGACAPPSALHLPPPTAPQTSRTEAEALRARDVLPRSFKMVHQVAAQFHGQTFLLSGYLLGRREGDFRVTGLAPVGPKLFDVARVDGRWETALYVDAAHGRLDPVHIGRAVQRIYFLTADGPLSPDQGLWRADGVVRDDSEVDTVQSWRAPDTLRLVHQRYSKAGAPVVDIDYEEPDSVQGAPYARRVRLTDARGFTLTLNVAEYLPGFPVDPAQLPLQRTGQPQTAP